MRNMLRLLMIPIAAVLLACGDGGAPSYPDNDGVPGNCENSAAVYYRPEILPRFDLNRNTLELVDWTTGETVTVLAQFDSIAYMSVLSWSPDCRYLMTHQRGAGVIWDTQLNRQVISFEDVPNFTRTSTSITWDSTTSYVTVESGVNTLLYTLGRGTVTHLTDHHFRRQYWDLTRGQLIGISSREIAAYDLNTGAKVATFGDLSGNYGLVFSEDRRMVVFFQHNAYGFVHDFSVHVFDRDTMQRTTFYIGDYVRPGRMAFSPDNRYLVISGWVLSVWDLTRPPAQAEQRETLYAHNGPEAYARQVRFVDATTVETISDEGVQYWNMHTGEPVTR